MRCNICDRSLSDTEVVFNKDLNAYEPCTTCLDVALDAAYSNGFNPDEEPLDDPDMQDQYGNGAVETIDPDYGQLDLFADDRLLSSSNDYNYYQN